MTKFGGAQIYRFPPLSHGTVSCVGEGRGGRQCCRHLVEIAGREEGKGDPPNPNPAATAAN